ncbi:MAG: hypothetical protein ACRC41_10625 [Sarcina sp.]
MVMNIFPFLGFVIYMYKFRILVIVVILIVLKKRFYKKNIFGKILFWGILIATIMYSLAVLVVLLASVALAPSFIDG